MLAVRHALARTRAKATSAVRPARAPAPHPGTSTPVHHRARAPAPSSPAPRQCCPFVMPTAKAGRRRISGGASAPGGRIGGRNDLQNEPPPPPTQEADEKRSTVERVLDFGETMYYTHVSVCVRAHVHTDRHTQRVLCRVDFMCQRRNGLFGMLTIHFNTHTLHIQQVNLMFQRRNGNCYPPVFLACAPFTSRPTCAPFTARPQRWPC